MSSRILRRIFVAVALLVLMALATPARAAVQDPAGEPAAFLEQAWEWLVSLWPGDPGSISASTSREEEDKGAGVDPNG